MSRRPPGRPSKLTPETRERFLAAIRNGYTIAAAAEHADLGERTVYNWLELAEEEGARAEFRQFRQDLTRARAELQGKLLESVMTVVEGGFVTKRFSRVLPNGLEESEETIAAPDGRLALEMLSRLFGREFASRKSIEVSGKDGGPIETVEGGLRGLARRVKAAIAAEAAEAAKGEAVDAEVVPD